MNSFKEGDRVAYVVISIVKHLAKRGTVVRATWSNDNGYSEHVWVRWDNRPEAEEIVPTGWQGWPIRKLDAVEALADIDSDERGE